MQLRNFLLASGGRITELSGSVVRYVSGIVKICIAVNPASMAWNDNEVRRLPSFPFPGRPLTLPIVRGACIRRSSLSRLTSPRRCPPPVRTLRRRRTRPA